MAGLKGGPVIEAVVVPASGPASSPGIGSMAGAPLTGGPAIEAAAEPASRPVIGPMAGGPMAGGPMAGRQAIEAVVVPASGPGIGPVSGPAPGPAGEGGAVPLMRYKAVDERGRRHTGRIEAANADDLEARLSRLGLELVNCGPAKAVRGPGRGRVRRGGRAYVSARSISAARCMLPSFW